MLRDEKKTKTASTSPLEMHMSYPYVESNDSIQTEPSDKCVRCRRGDHRKCERGPCGGISTQGDCPAHQGVWKHSQVQTS